MMISNKKRKKKKKKIPNKINKFKINNLLY